MTERIVIVPVEGRRVRDPQTGKEITKPTTVFANDPFWIRRIADGDVKQSQEGTK